jgi:hypothetical protein
MTKGPPPIQPLPPPKKLPRTQVLRAVRMPGKTLTSRLIKPVGST